MNSVENIRETISNNFSEVFSKVQNTLPIRALYLQQTIFTVFFLVIGLVFSIIAGIGDFTHNKTLFINYSVALVVCILITLTVYNFYFSKIKRLLPDMEFASVAVQIVCAAIPLSFYFLFIKIFSDTIIEIIYSIVAFVLIIWGVISSNGKNYRELLKKIAIPELLNQCDFIEYKNQDSLFKKEELYYNEITEREPESFEIDDSWKGKFEGCDFKISELKAMITVVTRHGRNDAYIFRGVLFGFDLGEKSFNVPFKILNCEEKNIKKVGAIFSTLIAAIILVFFYYVRILNDILMNVMCIICALFFILLGYVLIASAMKEKDKISSMKFQPYGSSQKKVDIFTDNLGYIGTFINEELLQCYFNIRKMFKTNHVDIIAKENNVYVSIKSGKNFFEFGSLFSSINPMEQTQAIVNQITQFMYLIQIFARNFSNNE